MWAHRRATHGATRACRLLMRAAVRARGTCGLMMMGRAGGSAPCNFGCRILGAPAALCVSRSVCVCVCVVESADYM